MKKLFTTLFILLVFYSISFAQEDPGTVLYGVEAGYNYSYATTSNSSIGSRVKTGFNADVSAEYYFSDTWSLKAKLLYVQRGFSNVSLILDDANGNQTEIDNTSFRLNYITIPITANWHFGTDGKYCLNLGPYLGMLINSQSNTYNSNGIFNTIDLGYDIDTGINFPLNDKLKLSIEVEGQGGLTNITKANSENGTIMINTESLNVGIIF